MCEQVRVPANTASNPPRSLSATPMKTFHLARGPKREPPVDHPQGGNESRLVEGSIVVDPPPDSCVEHSGEVVKAFVAASLQSPTPDLPPNRFRRLVAHRRAETDEEAAPLVLRPPGPECVAQKVKRILQGTSLADRCPDSRQSSSSPGAAQARILQSDVSGRP